MKTIQEKFEDVHTEWLEFDKIKDKLSQKPDIHAFILLDKIFNFKDNNNIISSCIEYDMIHLNVSLDQVKQLTENQILELVRCGVFYEKNYGLYLKI